MKKASALTCITNQKKEAISRTVLGDIHCSHCKQIPTAFYIIYGKIFFLTKPDTSNETKFVYSPVFHSKILSNGKFEKQDNIN